MSKRPCHPLLSVSHVLESSIQLLTPGHLPEFIRYMGLAVASFDRAHEPEGVSTMEWGTRTAIDTYRKLHNRVPDVVYDLGVVGKEPYGTAAGARGCGCGWVKNSRVLRKEFPQLKSGSILSGNFQL
ncbi:MAG: hypothetical protein JRE64_08135 [Deltaproteobacteria bacterium]|nr:hypothetical protein [Deltaproteobacteria bacterium]